VKRGTKRGGDQERPGGGGSPGLHPLPEQNGVYERGWQDYRRALGQAWQPYLDGKTGYEDALRGVIDALPTGTG
jgi:hypothetical protein